MCCINVPLKSLNLIFDFFKSCMISFPLSNSVKSFKVTFRMTGLFSTNMLNITLVPSPLLVAISILPPKEFTEKGKLWVRYVSPTPATVVDVLKLKEALEKRLVNGKARDVGICPIRENLFQQCFDELIRQITINCSERGFLLVRVRDEFR